MSLPVKSQLELYDLFIATLQSEAPQLTDTLTGSEIDALAGVFSIAGTEFTRLTIDLFNKTFIELANGPEITGGPDDLATLAVDHFGDAFERPAAVAATDTATFSRPTNTYGALTILSGTVVKTQPDVNGNAQRYTTNATVILTHGGATDLSVSVGITAVVAGADGDAVAGTIDVIETSLLDSTVVVTNTGNSSGTDEMDDSDYREFIRNLLISLRGATLEAVQAAARAVPGIAVAVALEVEQYVMPWDPSTNVQISNASYFILPTPYLYCCDSSGNLSGALQAAVEAAIADVEAFGINVIVVEADALITDWTVALTLNPSGPNYTTLLSDTSLIKQTMKEFMNNLTPGDDFIRSTGNNRILEVWGSGGSDDITAVSTTYPSGDIAVTGTQKIIPGTMATA